MYDGLIKTGAATLGKAVLNEEVRSFVLSNEKLYNVFKTATDRYSGGATLEEALACGSKLRDEGYAVTTDLMAESIHNQKDANQKYFGCN